MVISCCACQPNVTAGESLPAGSHLNFLGEPADWLAISWEMFKNLQPLFPYLRKYRATFYLGALCVLFHNAVWILFPLVIRAMMSPVRVR